MYQQSSFYDENNNVVGADAHPNEGTTVQRGGDSGRALALAAEASASAAAASQPSTSNASVWFEELSGTSGPRSHRRVSLQGELFHGVVEASKHGTHLVIRYPIPGGPLCYVFEYLRRTTQRQVVYRCIGCKRNRRTTSVAVLNGSDLVGDPALLPHVCLPRKNAQDRVTRIVYKSCQEIAKDTRLVNVRPRELWQNMAEQVHYQEGTGQLHSGRPPAVVYIVFQVKRRGTTCCTFSTGTATRRVERLWRGRSATMYSWTCILFNLISIPSFVETLSDSLLSYFHWLHRSRTSRFALFRVLNSYDSMRIFYTLLTTAVILTTGPLRIPFLLVQLSSDTA